MAFQNSLYALFGLPGGYSTGAAEEPRATGSRAESIVTDSRRIGWSYNTNLKRSRIDFKRRSLQSSRYKK